jgi:hypothetical protein
MVVLEAEAKTRGLSTRRHAKARIKALNPVNSVVCFNALALVRYLHLLQVADVTVIVLLLYTYVQ